MLRSSNIRKPEKQRGTLYNRKRRLSTPDRSIVHGIEDDDEYLSAPACNYCHSTNIVDMKQEELMYDTEIFAHEEYYNGEEDMGDEMIWEFQIEQYGICEYEEVATKRRKVEIKKRNENKKVQEMDVIKQEVLEEMEQEEIEEEPEVTLMREIKQEDESDEFEDKDGELDEAEEAELLSYLDFDPDEALRLLRQLSISR